MQTESLAKVAVKRLLTVVALSSSALIGCAADDDASAGAAESESAELAAHGWQTVLTCGGHGIVVEVDTAERRHLQAVVRDHAAVAYLAAHPGDGPSGIPNSKGELVIDGDVTHGVFSPSDFHGFDHGGYSFSDAFLPQAYASKDGKGVKVRFVTWKNGHEVETANWYFADCH